MTETFMTIEEVAELLRISSRSVYNMAQTGELPGAIKIGNQWRINRELLMEWTMEQATKAPDKSKKRKNK